MDCNPNLQILRTLFTKPDKLTRPFGEWLVLRLFNFLYNFMPNDYSVEIHRFLTDKIREAETQINASDTQIANIARGRMEELLWIRQYLKEHVDLKNFIYY